MSTRHEVELDSTCGGTSGWRVPYSGAKLFDDLSVSSLGPSPPSRHRLSSLSLFGGISRYTIIFGLLCG
jgi:hypothetical protein